MVCEWAICIKVGVRIRGGQKNYWGGDFTLKIVRCCGRSPPCVTWPRLPPPCSSFFFPQPGSALEVDLWIPQKVSLSLASSCVCSVRSAVDQRGGMEEAQDSLPWLPAARLPELPSPSVGSQLFSRRGLFTFSPSRFLCGLFPFLPLGLVGNGLAKSKLQVTPCPCGSPLPTAL